MNHFFQRIPFVSEPDDSGPDPAASRVIFRGMMGMEHGEIVLRYEVDKRETPAGVISVAALVEEPGSLVAPGFSFVDSILSHLEERFTSSGFPDLRETRIALDRIETVSLHKSATGATVEVTPKPRSGPRTDALALEGPRRLRLRIPDEFVDVAEAFVARTREAVASDPGPG